jgi:hypothetical protein
MVTGDLPSEGQSFSKPELRLLLGPVEGDAGSDDAFEAEVWGLGADEGGGLALRGGADERAVELM